MGTQWSMIRALITQVGFFVIVYEICSAYYGPDSAGGGAIVLIICFTVFILVPCLIVHVQYLKYNLDLSVTIDSTERTISLSYSHAEHSFNFEEIKFVQVSLTPPIYRGGKFGWFIWENYCYATLVSQGGERFIITGILINDPETFFKKLGFIVTRKKMFFPFIWEDRYEKIVNPRSIS